MGGTDAESIFSRLRLPVGHRGEFSEWRRKRMGIARCAIFAIIGLGYMAAAIHNEFLFGASEDVASFLRMMELGVSAPLLLAAAFLSLRGGNRRALTVAVQTAAVVAAVSSALVFRYLALSGDLDYPAQMSGIILVAFAMFGGFNWERIAIASVLYLGAAVTLEYSDFGGYQYSKSLTEAYAAVLMASMACGGALVHELLMRFLWTELSRVRGMREELARSEERFHAFLDHNPSVTWMKDDQGRYIYANHALCEFLGVEDGSWVGKTDADYFPPAFAEKSRELDLAAFASNAPSEVTGLARNAKGAARHWTLVRFPFTDSGGRRVVGGIAIDVTEKKRVDSLVRLQALTDELTGVYNRRGFGIVVEENLARARAHGLRCALIYVDLDKLKSINQQYGHAGGDAAIFSVGEALRIAANPDDIIGRVGGDEFLLFTTEVKTLAGLNTRIVEAISNYSQSEATPFKVTATIGIWEFAPDEGLSLEEQIKKADELMFSNKKWKSR